MKPLYDSGSSTQGYLIIVRTAHAFAEDKKLALEAGCNEYLSKPIRFSELVEVINRYISGKII